MEKNLTEADWRAASRRAPLAGFIPVVFLLFVSIGTTPGNAPRQGTVEMETAVPTLETTAEGPAMRLSAEKKYAWVNQINEIIRAQRSEGSGWALAGTLQPVSGIEQEAPLPVMPRIADPTRLPSEKMVEVAPPVIMPKVLPDRRVGMGDVVVVLEEKSVTTPITVQAVEAKEKPKPAPVVQLPMPQPLQWPNPLLLRTSEPTPLGSTPHPTAKDLQDFAEHVTDFVDPRNTLDLIKGRTRLMMLKTTPKRIQIADEEIMTHTLIDTKDISLLGKKVGETVLTLWFPSVKDKNKDTVLSYLVRVFPNPVQVERLKLKYKALEIQINQAFPDSVVHLQLVGEKVVVSGQAHDIHDATEILHIVGANTGQTGAGTQQRQRTGSGGDSTVKNNIPTDSINNLPQPGRPNATDGATPGQENYISSGNPNIINNLRVSGVQQVMLRVIVAEVNRTAARSIGLNLSIANRQGITVFQNTTGSILTPFGTSGALGAGSVGTGLVNGLANSTGLANLPAVVDNGQITLAINALKSMHYAKSLAEPLLTTSNGKAANFLAGGEFPVPVVTGNAYGGLQGVSFVPYGVQLNFTPYITDKDRIRLSMSANVSTRDTSVGTTIGNSVVPGMTSRNFSSTIELREGQTLAVAGLIQTNLGADRDQLPFLGEIPLLNRLTGFDRTSAGEQELVILITPELVQPIKAGTPLPRLPGADIFDPSDIEFYLCGRLEGLRTKDFRSPAMTDLQRIQRYNRCEQIYIFGPSGYQNGPAPAK